MVSLDTMEHMYKVAQENYPKGSPCPRCEKPITSIAVVGNDIIFKPCNHTFAYVTSKLRKLGPNEAVFNEQE